MGLVSVYLRRNVLLMYASSRDTGRWLARHPGVGLTLPASDHVVGALVKLLLGESRSVTFGSSPPGVPIYGLAGVKGERAFLGLVEGSVTVADTDTSWRIEVWRGNPEGAGQVGVTSLSRSIPLSASESALGGAIREALSQPTP
jgi:hypothetical protein